MSDIFRPFHEPSRTLYDALQKEASKREGRTVQEWQIAERSVMYQTAHDYAIRRGLRIPPIEDIEKAERMASGHVDYGAKWAYGIAGAMIPR